VLKAAAGGFGKAMKPSKYTKERYMELLAMLYEILQKARKEGLMAIENDVENPEASPLFQKYPTVGSDHHVVEFVTDYLRMMVSDIELETHHGEAHQASAALTRVSDGLPGFGIVAAVLGIVITMGALGGPASEIGQHVAAALVGTFLGILLAYGFVGPMATLVEHLSRDESQFYVVLKTVLIAAQQGYSPQIAVEFGRKAIFSVERPSFRELEEHVKRK